MNSSFFEKSPMCYEKSDRPELTMMSLAMTRSSNAATTADGRGRVKTQQSEAATSLGGLRQRKSALHGKRGTKLLMQHNSTFMRARKTHGHE